MNRIDRYSRPQPRAGLVLALILAAAPAALASEAGLRQCRALAEAPARLACYDALPLGPAAPARAASAAPAAPATPALAATDRTLPAAAPAPARVAGPPPAPGAPSAATAAAPPPAAEGSRFGFEQTRPAASEEVLSHIPGRFEGWRPNTRLVLANGQVWQISDGSSASLWLMDPQVSIRRAPISGFELRIQGANQRPRVRRIS